MRTQSPKLLKNQNKDKNQFLTSNIQDCPIFRIKAHLKRHHENNSRLHRNLKDVYVHWVTGWFFHFFEAEIRDEEEKDGDGKSPAKDEPES